MTKTGNKVATRKETNVATAYDYGDMSGQGFEGTKGSDLSIPFINLFQTNSPEVEDKTVEGAQPGDLYNTVTGELIHSDSALIFMPVHKDEQWVEWVPRVKGGGFVATHSPESELVQELIAKNGGSRIPPTGGDGKRVPFKSPDKNEVIETYYVYGLILSADGSEVESFAVIAFSSTKIKPYRDWLTAMFMLKGKPPIFANRAKISCVKQRNDSGTFYNYDITPLRSTWSESLINPNDEKHLLEEAKHFQDMISQGIAKADFNQQQQSGTGSDEGEDAPF